MTDQSLISAPHKNFEEIKKIDENGIEYWEARELMPLLGYFKWSNFEKVVIKKAKIACRKSDQILNYHFADIGKMIKIAVGTSRETTRKIQDYKLSRYACYLIAQNGDPKKQEIANAQTYFAIQTRKQEIFQQLEKSEQRLSLRGKVKTHNKELNTTAYQAGVKNFGKFNNAGYLGLYGMKAKSVQKKKKIKGEGKATFTHIVVGQKVRKSIKDIGGTMPENLPPEPHIKQLEKQKILSRKILIE